MSDTQQLYAIINMLEERLAYNEQGLRQLKQEEYLKMHQITPERSVLIKEKITGRVDEDRSILAEVCNLLPPSDPKYIFIEG